MRRQMIRYPNGRVVHPAQQKRPHQIVQDLGEGPRPLEYPDIPIDLWPRRIEQYVTGPGGEVLGTGDARPSMEDYLARIARDTWNIASTLVLERGLLGRVVTVTTVPQRVIFADFLRGFLLLNPAQVAGLTSGSTVLSSAARTTTGESASIGVANFLDGHFFLDVTNITGVGTLDIVAQALDPTSLKWVDTQTLFSVSTTGQTYAFVDEIGIATDFRVRWDISGGATFTFSLGAVIKDGLIGTSGGLVQTIFLGGPGVSVESGYPLLNGKERAFYLRENTELFAVANASLPLHIFEL